MRIECVYIIFIYNKIPFLLDSLYFNNEFLLWQFYTVKKNNV